MTNLRWPSGLMFGLRCALFALAAGPLMAAADGRGPAGDPPGTRASRPWRIAFMPKFKFLGQTGALSSYWQPAWEGAQGEGSELGVDVRLVVSRVKGDRDSDYVEPQIRLVAGLVARREVDGLVIAPFDSNRLAPVLDKAAAAGIRIIAMDTPVNSSRMVTLVSFDNFEAGRQMGQWVVGELHGRGKALILEGSRDQENAVERRRGFLAGLAGGAIDLLDMKSADWETEPARAVTEGWLREYPEVSAIMAANDNMALGAARAVRAAGRQGILITGFDATKPGLEAVASGAIGATVDQAPGEQARLAIRLLVRELETGQTYPSVVLLPKIRLVTRTDPGPDRSR